MPGNQNELNQQLIKAAEEGNLADVQGLIKQGADVNAKNKYGWTPLRLAARRGHTEIVKSLLANGADPSIKEKDGKIALEIANEDKNTDAAQIIENFGKEGGLQIVKSIKAQQQIQHSLFIATPLLAIAAGASVFFKLSEKIFKEDKNMQGANIYVFVPALVCLVATGLFYLWNQKSKSSKLDELKQIVNSLDNKTGENIDESQKAGGDKGGSAGIGEDTGNPGVLEGFDMESARNTDEIAK